MNKSLIIQTCILTIILIIGYFTFTYLNKDVNLSSKDIKAKNIDKTEFGVTSAGNKQSSNKILDLSYRSSDDKGNTYEIKSVSGSIDEENENILLLKNVTAKILIFDYGTFEIKSKNAEYNKLTLDTHFFNEVNLLYLDHFINSGDLFLKYVDKEVKITNNVKYNYNNNFLKADEIYLDLVKRTSQIYMKDKNKKVKAIIKK
tara:strand:- start:272 stop:877 length:606 start_codon:yes stop_codon:yes gene_type:complete